MEPLPQLVTDDRLRSFECLLCARYRTKSSVGWFGPRRPRPRARRVGAGTVKDREEEAGLFGMRTRAFRRQVERAFLN